MGDARVGKVKVTELVSLTFIFPGTADQRSPGRLYYTRNPGDNGRYR